MKLPLQTITKDHNGHLRVFTVLHFEGDYAYGVEHGTYHVRKHMLKFLIAMTEPQYKEYKENPVKFLKDVRESMIKHETTN